MQRGKNQQNTRTSLDKPKRKNKLNNLDLEAITCKLQE